MLKKPLTGVDWGLKIKPLDSIGLGPRMIQWIKVLYKQPTAVIKINGELFPSFKMKNETRQGCPLSPLLFVLSLEPLLAMIRSNPDIEGIGIGDEEHKLAAFANDLLFYISNPKIKLPNLLKTLKQYGEISNFKINLNKSKILSINITKQDEQSLQKDFQFPWRREGLKYLGVKLASSLKKIYKINYIPLLDELKNKVKKIALRPLSWIGRINTVKMVLLLKITYKQRWGNRVT